MTKAVFRLKKRGGEAEMAVIIALINQKGGVGKTTSAVNISAGLGFFGKRTLLCDIDPQGNATSGVGVNKKDAAFSIYDVLSGSADMNDAVIHTKYKNLDVVPSNINLAGAEIELAERENRECILRKSLWQIYDKYDYIIIDCPPSLGMLTLNALAASDRVIVPMQCEYYALEGLSQLVFTIKQVKRLYNPQLTLDGVILTMYDGRLNLSIQVMEEIKKYFPDKVYKNAVPRNVRLSEAPSHGMPIIYYDKYSKGSLAYLEIAKEIISKSPAEASNN